MSTHFILRLAEQARRFNHPHEISASAAATAFVAALPSCCNAPLESLDAKRVWCPRCGRRFGLRAQTPFHHSKVSLLHIVQAVWHVVATDQTIPARTFGERYRLRAQTAWRLLHTVRGALPDIQVNSGTTRSQVLGQQNANNTAFAQVGLAGGTVVCKTDEEETPPDSAPPEARLDLGYVRAWLVHHFRGVTRRWLFHYLLEWSFKRVMYRKSAEPLPPKTSGPRFAID